MAMVVTECNSIEGMWASLKRATALEQNVRTKMSSTRHTHPHPWVFTSLRRIMRRKQRAHRKAKRSGQSKDWDRFKGCSQKFSGQPILHCEGIWYIMYHFD